MEDLNHNPEYLESDQMPERSSRAAELWKLLKRNRLALIGLFIFILFFIVALTGLLLTSGSKPFFDPAMVRLQEKLRPPLALPEYELLSTDQIPPLGMYLLGTDDLGRDVFARMLQGAWVSLTVGFVAVGISVVIGIIFGGIAGYWGHGRLRIDHLLAISVLLVGIIVLLMNLPFLGILLLVLGSSYLLYDIKTTAPKVTAFTHPLKRLLFTKTISIDTLIMRFVDIMLCFPSFFLILTVVALLPASIYNIMIVIGLTSWMGTTRFVRAEILSLREQDFVTAAKALGLNGGRIIFRHIIPNAIAPVLVSATIGIASAILTEAGLSFLGFGVPPPHATWGNILADGKRFIFDAPWLTFVPGFAILTVVLSFNLFGEGLRDILNPRLRERF
jgi:peptide/nickel transport system permease protein